MRHARHALLTLSILAVVATATLTGATTRAQPRVELVMVDPGDALWTRFGHIAIRVIHPARDLDALFGFGFAPFGDPDFIWSYLRGEAYFELAARPWDGSLDRYRGWDRTVRRRSLNLPPDRQRELLSRLVENARPENAGYRYDHLHDNCSTRIRDLIDAVTDGALRAAVADRDPGTTYRNYTLEAGSGRTFVQIIFDYIGGPNQEQAVDGYAELYLPEYLEQAAVEATVDWGEGDIRPLVGPPIIEYERQAPPPISGNLGAGRRAVVGFGVLIGLLLLAAGWTARRPIGVARGLARASGLGLALAALSLGLLGLALLALVVISRVADFAWNENVLVFWPLDLVWVATGLRWLFSGRLSAGPLVRGYTTARLALLAAYGAAKGVGMLPQDNWAFLGCAVAVVGGLWLALRLAPTSDL